MRLFTSIATLLWLGFGVDAQTTNRGISSADFEYYRNTAAVAYQYGQGKDGNGNKCQASYVYDYQGTRWDFVGAVALFDGSSNPQYNATLLRRDSSMEYYLLFPGSASFDDYQRDAKFNLVDYNMPYCASCQVHQGFYEGWTQSRSRVIYLINALASKDNYKLVIAGGSLGGAIGALAYADFKLNPSAISRPLSKAVSFGEPRTGNFQFAKWFDNLSGVGPNTVGNYMRFTHGYDAIVKSPPVIRYNANSTPGNVYQHHGTEIWFQDDTSANNRPTAANTYTCYNNADQSESQQCANGPAPPFSQNPGNILDHTNYPGYGELNC